MEQLKKKYHQVADYSKMKCSHFRGVLKKKTVPSELAQRNVIPEYPLILLHGYWNAPIVWKRFVVFFEANGYVQDKNLFLFDGRGENAPANIDIRINAKKLQDLVQHSLTLNGASKVNLVAHSMGGLVSRWYIEQMGGDATVNKLIMLGTPNHGSKYLPLLTRIVGYIDDKLEEREIHKLKLEQLKEKNALHRAIHKLKDKDKHKEKKAPKLLDQKNEQEQETENWFDEKTEESIDEHIQQVVAENDIDHLGMAALQMDPGSEFLTTLGYDGKANYYLVTGTKGFPTGIGGYLPEGDNDGVVHADSVDLTEVPVSHKVMFKVSHMQLFYKVVTFNQVMNFLVL